MYCVAGRELPIAFGFLDCKLWRQSRLHVASWSYIYTHSSSSKLFDVCKITSNIEKLTKYTFHLVRRTHDLRSIHMTDFKEVLNKPCVGLVLGVCGYVLSPPNCHVQCPQGHLIHICRLKSIEVNSQAILNIVAHRPGSSVTISTWWSLISEVPIATRCLRDSIRERFTKKIAIWSP